MYTFGGYAPFKADNSLLVGSAPASTAPMSFSSSLGPVMAVLGAVQSGIGSYYSTKSMQANLEFQAEMAAINSRAAERTAQSIMRAGEDAQGKVSLRAGKVKSSQKVRQAARGVQIGVGSAAEETASTDLIKEMDMLTINANAVRQAWAARAQGVNLGNESLLKGTMASGLSPFASAMPDLISGATKVASSWYSNKRLAALASLLKE